MEQRKKDDMVKFRSVENKKNSKGGDMKKVYMDADQVDLLVDILQREKTARGIRIDFHETMKKVFDENGEPTGREFLSLIAFVKGVQENTGFVANGGGLGRGRAASGAASEATKSAIERLKNGSKN